MNAYIVILKCFENDEECSGNAVKIITVSESLDSASEYAVKSYEKADGPLTPGFHWKAIHAEWIEGKVALPDTKQIRPKA